LPLPRRRARTRPGAATRRAGPAAGRRTGPRRPARRLFDGHNRLQPPGGGLCRTRRCTMIRHSTAASSTAASSITGPPRPGWSTRPSRATIRAPTARAISAATARSTPPLLRPNVTAEPGQTSRGRHRQSQHRVAASRASSQQPNVQPAQPVPARPARATVGPPQATAVPPTAEQCLTSRQPQPWPHPRWGLPDPASRAGSRPRAYQY